MSARPWWLLPPGRIRPVWWVAIGAVILAIDLLNGPSVPLPAVYVIPIALAAWYSGVWPAVALAVAVPLVRLAFLFGPLDLPSDPGSFILTTLFRGAVVIVMALWFARLADLERDLARRVNVLEGLLPICAFCKNIRNEAGEWERLEAFISRKSAAEFSHGVCPSCSEKHYPDMLSD